MSVTNDGIVTNVWDFSEADGVWDSYLSYSGVVVGVWDSHVGYSGEVVGV